ncbi:MAG: B12-binding domain-containing radical SAM protein, partial [Candidatus Bathyarchaeia archaeon]
MGSPKIVLTAPANEMSNHHGKIFTGFGASISDPPFPVWFTRRLFYPPTKHANGRACHAPYGLRKVEAALVANGFSDLVVVHPYMLGKTVGPETKAIGISCMDPLNLGPTSLTFSSIFRGEAATYIEFKKMMRNPVFKKFNPKIIAGGPGAWQLHMVRDAQQRYGIDTVVLGAGEKVLIELFSKAINEIDLPKTVFAPEPDDEEIAPIKYPSVGGLVEVSRGCGRRCQFCLPDMRERKDFPIARVVKEIRINHDAGANSICLHAEDVMIYGTGPFEKFRPNREKLMQLFTTAVEATKHRRIGIGMSHSSLPPIACDPHAVSLISDVLEIGKSKRAPLLGYQTGIESGSTRIMKKYMGGKSLPYRPEEWPEVVEMAFGTSKDYGWVPTATLIMGMPGETVDDVNASIDLVDDVKDTPSFIVPQFFTPITETILENETIFDVTKMFPEHWKLLARCLEHSVRWADHLRTLYFSPESRTLQVGYWLGYKLLYFFANWGS